MASKSNLTILYFFSKYQLVNRKVDTQVLEFYNKNAFCSGVRYIAFEKLQRTNELKMVGVLVCNKVFPWTADEFEQWTLLTDSTSEQTHMYFKAHVLRGARLFTEFHTPYVYEVSLFLYFMATILTFNRSIV